MPITLKQLTYFQALAETASFGAAAEMVHISQPAMSLQIKALEDEFGARLVTRGKGGITLTDLGREVLARSNTILCQAKDLAALSKKSRLRPVGPLRLGIIPTIAPYLLPQCFSALRESFDGTNFVIREGKTETLVENLNRNRLDLAILALPVETRNLEIRELFDDPFCLATGPSFDARGKTVIPATEITQNPLLLLEEGHCLRDQAIRVCGSGGSFTHNAFTATSLSTILEMVANDYGVTLLPKMSLEKEANDPRINLYPLSEPTPSRTIALLWRKSSSYGKFYHEIGNLVAETFMAAQRNKAL
jgi:LysR family hydrogen peroxide-inducible transcriptional activator